MKWYKMIMSTDDEDVPPCPFLAEEEDLFGLDYDVLSEGRLVNGWNPRSLLRGVDPEYNGRMDDILGNAARFPVFSERLRSALRESDVATRDIQYLPIRVLRYTGEEVHGFAVANVITRVRALDPDRSFMLDLDYDKVDPLTGEADVRGVGRPGLKSEALEGHDVIRLLEFFPPIFVSERFFRVFKKHRCTGASFTHLVVS